jgi:predicted Rossmann-fold nucleotide-binding protein
MSLIEVANLQHPIIGIIGAINPSPEYDSDDAYRLGYDLREAIADKGTLFTGGVPGVGIDAYRGITDYCRENGADDRFFVLFPEGMEPPQTYFQLAKQTRNQALRIVRAGKSLDDRRAYVGPLADVLVVDNGSSGTIDEALQTLVLGKQVVCLQNSGGAADVLTRFKNGSIEIPLKVDRDLIKPFSSISWIVNYIYDNFNNNSGGNRK